MPGLPLRAGFAHPQKPLLLGRQVLFQVSGQQSQCECLLISMHLNNLQALPLFDPCSLPLNPSHGTLVPVEACSRIYVCVEYSVLTIKRLGP